MATKIGLQDVLNRLASAEALLETIKTVPAIAKVIKQVEAEKGKEAEAAVRDLEEMQAAAAEKNLKAEAPAEEL